MTYWGGKEAADTIESLRRQVAELQGDLTAKQSVLEDYIRSYLQAAKWQQHYLNRAEKAEAENAALRELLKQAEGHVLDAIDAARKK